VELRSMRESPMREQALNKCPEHFWNTRRLEDSERCRSLEKKAA
jgi:hypothetical protein